MWPSPFSCLYVPPTKWFNLAVVVSNTNSILPVEKRESIDRHGCANGLSFIFGFHDKNEGLHSHGFRAIWVCGDVYRKRALPQERNEPLCPCCLSPCCCHCSPCSFCLCARKVLPYIFTHIYNCVLTNTIIAALLILWGRVMRVL